MVIEFDSAGIDGDAHDFMDAIEELAAAQDFDVFITKIEKDSGE
jgi:hypothetical protein